MKEHEFIFYSRTDMTIMKEIYYLRCKKCSSTMLAYTPISAEIDSEFIQNKLRREWNASYSPDCDEMKLINEVARVQES